MDIGTGKGYPNNALSNFTPYRFEVDGVVCFSMEGFLQSLKFNNEAMQIEVCKMVGRQAKFKGKRKNWYITQELHWKGNTYKRDSTEYQDLLDKAFNCLSKNEKFQKALLASGNAVFTHSMGKTRVNDTVLTTKEFCSRLTKIRQRLKETINV